MNLKDEILNRIDQLLKQTPDLAELYLAVTNMFETIYGSHSLQLRLLETLREEVYDSKDIDLVKRSRFTSHLYGCLRTLRSDIRAGLIVNIQSEARGKVLGNFLALAREALDTGQKDVAAVLACAALEDTLKRCASDRGLDVQDKNMSEVVNALKSKGIIGGPQGDTLRGYVQIRNKAFHAQWEAIDIAAVSGIIGYTQGFLAEQSVSPIPTDSPIDPPAEAQE